MDYIIIGGDERFAWLARMLRGRGRDVGTLYREPVPGVPALASDALAAADAVVVNCPPRLKGGDMDVDRIARRLPDSAKLLLCGPKHPEPRADFRTVDLWADEELQRENAKLTAEGAVCAAMRAGRRALRDTRCLVIGWGRIGRALTELLTALAAGVTVASRSPANRLCAAQRGADFVDTGRIAEALPGCGLVFNTAPAMVLDAAALARAKEDAMIIDLASPPYGVDLRAAWARGLRAWREPGLPGRYCPMSAARALTDAIIRWEERDSNG